MIDYISFYGILLANVVILLLGLGWIASIVISVPREIRDELKEINEGNR